MATSANSSGRAARRRNTALTWSALLLLALVCWVVTVRDALMMGAMPGTMGMGIASFTTMWAVMMAAMMLPALAPIASLYLRIMTRQSRGLVRGLRVAAFVAGYLLVWSALGLAAYALARGAGKLFMDAPHRVTPLAMGVLLVCGIYQFTPLKDACLRHCRSPLGFLFQFGNYRGRLRDLRVGLYHGAYCTGCCLGLMTLMIITGVMNLTWMIALALVIFVEKVWRYGRGFSRVVGLALITLACLLPWYPGLLRGL